MSPGDAALTSLHQHIEQRLGDGWVSRDYHPEDDELAPPVRSSARYEASSAGRSIRCPTTAETPSCRIETP